MRVGKVLQVVDIVLMKTMEYIETIRPHGMGFTVTDQGYAQLL